MILFFQPRNRVEIVLIHFWSNQSPIRRYGLPLTEVDTSVKFMFSKCLFCKIWIPTVFGFIKMVWLVTVQLKHLLVSQHIFLIASYDTLTRIGLSNYVITVYHLRLRPIPPTRSVESDTMPINTCAARRTQPRMV